LYTHNGVVFVTQKLLLNSNKITSIEDGSLDALTSLTNLALSDNRLVDLPTNLFHSLNSLEVGFLCFRACVNKTFVARI